MNMNVLPLSLMHKETKDNTLDKDKDNTLTLQKIKKTRGISAI